MCTFSVFLRAVRASYTNLWRSRMSENEIKESTVLQEGELSNDSPLTEIAKVLISRGYNLRKADNIWQAFHRELWSFEFDERVGGILFQFFVRTEKDKVSEIEMLRWINELNQQANVTRFYQDEEGDFAAEAWWPNTYDSRAFAAFLDAWINDGRFLTNHRMTGRIL